MGLLNKGGLETGVGGAIMSYELGEDLKGVLQCSDALEICMAMEREGIAYYEKAARMVSNEKAREVLTRLAGEEREHARALQDKSRFLQPAVQRRAASKPEVRRFIHEHILGKVFPDEPGRNPEALIRTDAEAVDIGIQSEKNSIRILERMLEQVTKIDVRTVFSHLMAEEKKHLQELQALKAELP